MNSDSPHLRFAIVGIVTISLFASLFARLWFLQVMTSPQYEIAARNNAVRDVMVEAPRGRILDRRGTVLVENGRTIEVTVDWQEYNKLEKPDQTKLLSRLASTLTRFALKAAAGDSTFAPQVPETVPGQTTLDTTTTTSTTTTAPSTTLVVGPDGVAEPPATPEPVTVASLRKRLQDERFSHFKPVPVAKDVSQALEIYLAEHADLFPTVAAEPVTVREYRYGKLLAHVLGYVGAVNEDDLKQFQNKLKPYENSDEVGKTGIERTMEAQLRGVPGVTRYEVDARNKPVRVVNSTAPVPGDDIYLTIDIGLQYVVESALARVVGTPGRCTREGCPQARSGAAVVTDPRSGQVLAMASYPTYDPRLFTGGISTADYAQLNSDANGSPILNRAIAGQYAPGSTWKLFTAYSGLENKQVQPDTKVNDPGVYAIKQCTGSAKTCTRQNAGRAGHGTVDLQRALTVSSDVYFYQLGDDMWRYRQYVGEDALAKTYAKWGFGSATGVGLPGEQSGTIPSPAWLKDFSARVNKGDPEAILANGRWNSGQNMNTAIGQGYTLVTPLQLANGYATFANGGTLYRPTLVAQVIKGFTQIPVSSFKATVVRKIPLPLEWRLPMTAGFEGVTTDGNGTAYGTFATFPGSFPVGGKTGTAQVKGKNDTSLFAAFAPATDPRYAVVVILPEAGSGGSAAAPTVRHILQPIAQVGGDETKLPLPPEGGFIDPKASDGVDAPPSAIVDR